MRRKHFRGLGATKRRLTGAELGTSYSGPDHRPSGGKKKEGGTLAGKKRVPKKAERSVNESKAAGKKIKSIATASQLKEGGEGELKKKKPGKKKGRMDCQKLLEKRE